MFSIAGQLVKVVTGAKSQTVRVYGFGERSIACQHTIRLSPPATTERELVAKRFSSVDELLGHLTAVLGGWAEFTPSAETTRLHAATVRHTQRGKQWPRDHVDLSPWGIGARAATERAINLLVREFCEFPMHHRVEHSIHCRLFQLLAMQPELQVELPFRSGVTQPIHKEWPEFIARPEKRNGRRGNFDMAILAPEIVADATREEFRHGWIRPTIAIEVGLDYSHTHLIEDIRKLENSGVRDSYLVHFVRDGVHDDFDTLEHHIVGATIKVAYARHTATGVRCKELDEIEIRSGVRGSTR